MNVLALTNYWVSPHTFRGLSSLSTRCFMSLCRRKPKKIWKKLTCDINSLSYSMVASFRVIFTDDFQTNAFSLTNFFLIDFSTQWRWLKTNGKRQNKSDRMFFGRRRKSFSFCCFHNFVDYWRGETTKKNRKAKTFSVSLLPSTCSWRCKTSPLSNLLPIRAGWEWRCGGKSFSSDARSWEILSIALCRYRIVKPHQIR